MGGDESQGKRQSKKYVHCPDCDYQCEFPARLEQHRVSHAKGDERERLLFSCKICDFRTLYVKSLRRHIGAHTNEEQFKCQYCSFRTAAPRELKRHILDIHEDISVWTCPLCNCKCLKKSSLTSHQKFCRLKDTGGSTPYKGYRSKCKKSTKSTREKRRDQQLSGIPEALGKDEKLLVINNDLGRSGRMSRNTYGRSNRGSRALRKKFIPPEKLTARIFMENAVFSCNLCKYTSQANEIIALHNEYAHSVPFITLTSHNQIQIPGQNLTNIVTSSADPL